MNEQERLTQIKIRRLFFKRPCSECGQHQHHLDIDDINWLLQQAEEKQELERRNNELIEGINHNNKEYGLIIDENEQLKRQNKRYEEALNEIYENKEDLSSYNDILIAERALQNK